jgi:4-diphosphocytidyl-2-C-methyl-D-erythritol kinase
MITAPAPAKINLGLAVGPVRADGMHELATILQRVDLADTISLEPAERLSVDGFAGDTLVRGALETLAAAAGVEPSWRAVVDKRIPLAAGLGGGSSDAATALRLANVLLPEPLPPARLHELACGLGSDVPFFLDPGPKLATGDGTTLAPIELPQEFTVLLLLPHGAHKPSTASVYAGYRPAQGFERRRQAIAAIAAAGRDADLGGLPGNDLARSEHTGELEALGAFHAQVSGAGPTVYGLFADRERAERGRAAVEPIGATWLVNPAW